MQNLKIESSEKITRVWIDGVEIKDINYIRFERDAPDSLPELTLTRYVFNTKDESE